MRGCHLMGHQLVPKDRRSRGGIGAREVSKGDNFRRGGSTVAGQT